MRLCDLQNVVGLQKRLQDINIKIDNVFYIDLNREKLGDKYTNQHMSVGRNAARAAIQKHLEAERLDVIQSLQTYGITFDE